jgi:hypothetical protein
MEYQQAFLILRYPIDGRKTFSQRGMAFWRFRFPCLSRFCFAKTAKFLDVLLKGELFTLGMLKAFAIIWV